MMLLVSVFIIPLAIFLVGRGIYILVKGESKLTTWFVISLTAISLTIAIYFLFVGKEISDPLVYLMFPFGMFGFFLIVIAGYGKSLLAVTFGFILGSFFNACAFASLIQFVQKLLRPKESQIK